MYRDDTRVHGPRLYTTELVWRLSLGGLLIMANIGWVRGMAMVCAGITTETITKASGKTVR